MKKLVVTMLAAGALFGAAVASQAQTLTYTLLTDTPWTDTTVGGVAGVGTGGTGTFDPTLTNILLSPLGNPAPPGLGIPTVLHFGDDFTFQGTAAASTFTNFVNTPVDFHFTLDDGTDPLDTFHVVGNINGVVGYNAASSPFSLAHITYTSITDTQGNLFTASADPNNTLPALKITANFGGNPVNVYLDTPFSKPVPNQTLSSAGFLDKSSNVPEPGAVTLLASSCITGSLFLFRKVRRA